MEEFSDEVNTILWLRRQAACVLVSSLSFHTFWWCWQVGDATLFWFLGFLQIRIVIWDNEQTSLNLLKMDFHLPLFCHLGLYNPRKNSSRLLVIHTWLLHWGLDSNFLLETTNCFLLCSHFLWSSELWMGTQL